MTTDEIKRNIDCAIERIDRAQCDSGRPVTVVAATKTVPAELIDFAVGCGIKNVGENRVQEYLAKRDAVADAVWHFIGTLQSNKAKYLVGNIALIQSVNSISLAREIDRLAARRGVCQDVLVEVNVAGESSKTGVSYGQAAELIESVCELENVRLRGLMAVPPRDADDGVYKRLSSLYEAARRNRPDFDILSVGMSADYERAIAFGSNMVRLGSAIFGPRA